MNTPSANLPQPKIEEPLSFRIVKRDEKKKQKKKFLDKILEPSFLKDYFKKKK
jgi:hypothetical protein|tara:strand:- start:500 stop:658 length:159 start_codon:yes stop_codon:yes gene_type:complete